MQPVAVTGAELPIFIDGEEHPGWTALAIKAGQKLSFGYLKAGARAYIAISGGIDTPPALGSRSTYAIGALGGVDGRAIAEGDALPIGQGPGGTIGASVGAELRRDPGSPVELRVLPGLYWHRITEAAQKRVFRRRMESRARGGPHGLPLPGR